MAALQVAHLRAERDILKIVDCHFIVKLLGFFHDDHCVYFVLQCVNGGEFFRHLRARGRCTQVCLSGARAHGHHAKGDTMVKEMRLHFLRSLMQDLPGSVGPALSLMKKNVHPDGHLNCKQEFLEAMAGKHYSCFLPA